MKSLIQFIKEEQVEMNGFAILKPEFLEWSDQFIDLLKNNGWYIIQKTRKTLTLEQAEQLYIMHKDKDFYDELCKYMSSDDCLICTCQKNCDNPIKDMKGLKDQVREYWGKDDMRNAMHSSDSLENVYREAKICLQ